MFLMVVFTREFTNTTGHLKMPSIYHQHTELILQLPNGDVNPEYILEKYRQLAATYGRSPDVLMVSPEQYKWFRLSVASHFVGEAKYMGMKVRISDYRPFAIC